MKYASSSPLHHVATCSALRRTLRGPVRCFLTLVSSTCWSPPFIPQSPPIQKRVKVEVAKERCLDLLPSREDMLIWLWPHGKGAVRSHLMRGRG